MATQQYVGVHKPEAARKKYSFIGCQAVIAYCSVIAHHQSINQKCALDRFYGAAHTWVRRRQESDHW